MLIKIAVTGIKNFKVQKQLARDKITTQWFILKRRDTMLPILFSKDNYNI